MKEHIFRTQQLIHQPIEGVFNFFSKAENLNLVTPPQLQFKILTPLPIKMETGAIIDYRLKIFNILVKWTTRINLWEPPCRFIDIQLAGPYKKWEHEHIFEEKNGDTLMTDCVTYQVPGWIFSPLIHSLFIKTEVTRIFDFRRKQFSKIFLSGELENSR